MRTLRTTELKKASKAARSAMLELLEGRRLLSVTTAVSSIAASRADLRFIQQTVASDQLDVALGNLAQTNASSQSVKDAASATVTDRTAIETALASTASALGVAVSTSLSRSDQHVANRLTSLTGPTFDSIYSTLMKVDHRADLASFNTEARFTASASLKLFATNHVSTINSDLMTWDATMTSVRGAARVAQRKTTPTPITAPITPITVTPVTTTSTPLPSPSGAGLGGTLNVGDTGLGDTGNTTINSSTGSVFNNFPTGLGSTVAVGSGSSTLVVNGAIGSVASSFPTASGGIGTTFPSAPGGIGTTSAGAIGGIGSISSGAIGGIGSGSMGGAIGGSGTSFPSATGGIGSTSSGAIGGIGASFPTVTGGIGTTFPSAPGGIGTSSTPTGVVGVSGFGASTGLFF